MIIGTGFIAKLLMTLDQPHLIIWASGVSDPSCTDPKEFNREEDLLNAWIMKYPEKTFVYFGTTTSKDSPYAKHKKRMEELIQKNLDRWLIIRIGPVIGSNGNTFYDFAKRRIENDEEFILWAGEKRPLLTHAQLYWFVELLLKEDFPNSCISFDGPWIPVEQIVSSLEISLNKKARYTVK